jgi:ketosteroid isomerase-like protein
MKKLLGLIITLFGFLITSSSVNALRLPGIGLHTAHPNFCNPDFCTPDSSEVLAELKASNLAYGASFSKADSSGFMNAYAPDAWIMSSGSPALRSPQARLAFYKFAYKAGVRNVVFTTVAIYGLTDDYVTEQGNYELFDGNQVSLGKGKYLVLWKKTALGWKMFRDMFNEDARPSNKSK